MGSWDNIVYLLQDYFGYIRPILEIGLIALLIYHVLYFLRGTRAASVLAGIIIILILLTVVSDWLKFEVISWLLYSLWTMLAVALIVIFQPELRRAFAQLGSSTPFHQKTKKKEAITEVVNAILTLSKQKIGALVVFERQIGMAFTVNNAIPLDIKLNSYILECIFNPYSPLHDGAVIIKNEKIIAAHAILPLPHDETLVLKLGTRHRAAIGITEETDCVAVVVSEKTGIISIACGGRLKRHIEPEKVSRFLNSLLISNESFFNNIFGPSEESDEIIDGFDEDEVKHD